MENQDTPNTNKLNIGLVIAMVGFMVSISPVALGSLLEIKMPFITVIIGLLVSAIGFATYIKAFISNIKNKASQETAALRQNSHGSNHASNKKFKPTQLRVTCFVLNSTKSSPAPSVGLTER